MKKISLLILLILVIASANAQNFLISFAGTGASTTVDSVKVENITQCTEMTISGHDSLNLSGSTETNELNGPVSAANIFPNPSHGSCFIEFETTVQGPATIKVYDLTGKKILEAQEILSAGRHTYELNGIGSGIYMLKIGSESSSYCSKIVVTGETWGSPSLTRIETLPGNGNQNASTGIIKTGSVNSISVMYYKTNDLLKITGKSGIFRTVFMLVPTQSRTITFNFVPCTDADGNNYAVVQIGTQVWMAENLTTTKYSDNTAIPRITDTTQWANAAGAAYCEYGDSLPYGDTYGKLYNWFTGHYSTPAKNLAPAGWHVPTDVEWLDMYHYLSSMQSEKLRETCSGLWLPTSDKANNNTGFTALPAGNRDPSGKYEDIRVMCYFWTNHACSSSTGLEWFFDNTGVMNGQCRLYHNGFSVRCIKD
jgi:uncharacterized protein (TIGR02145 family)